MTAAAEGAPESPAQRPVASYLAPAVPFLLALFFFYAHLELLLPANF